MSITERSGPRTIAALLTAGLWLASPAAADPSQFPQPGSQPADVIAAELQRLGYVVAINWINNANGEPLSRCKVTGYQAPGSATTVYMDVVCPDGD